MIQFDTIFEGARVPLWLRAFERAPREAIEDLLVGRADFGLLSAEEPSLLLLDWLAGLGDRDGFASEIDDALAAWTDGSWGNPTLDKANGSASLTAVAWCRAADVIAMDERLDKSADCLRQHVVGDRRFLNALTEGRGRDPMARAWLAIARHQHDRELVDHWWRLCSLPPNEPWYRGAYGIHGLRGLPPADESRSGGFSQEVAEGLATLSRALHNRQNDGWVTREVAQNEFLRTARMTMAAYPFPREWKNFWTRAVDRCEHPAPREWIEMIARLNGQSDLITSGRRSRRASLPQTTTGSDPDPHWKEIVVRIADRLQNSDWSVIGQAEKLLKNQAEFAEKTGATRFVTRTACNFAGKLRKQEPRRALRWAELARRFEPWNPYAWTTSVSALRTMERNREALILALQAVDLFPENEVIRNNLAEILKAEERFEDAESVYRQTIEHFPKNDVARSGLAEVLKAQGQFAKAEYTYRDAMQRFPDDAVIRNGLAEVLKAQKRFSEAKSVYRENIERSPGNVSARFGLAELLKDERRIEEKSEEEFDELLMVYREIIDRFPKNPYAQTGLAEALKARKRYGDAAAVYHDAVQRFPHNAAARCGLAEVLKMEGRVDEALSVYRDAIDRFPKDIVARKGLRSLLNDLSRPDEAAALAADSAKATEDLAAANTELRTDDISILLADAYLLRRWRFQAMHHAVKLSTGALGERARELLRQLMPLIGRDSRAATEAGLLTLTQGDLEEAVEFLSQASERFHGSLRVHFALARAQRELARVRKRKLSAEAETDVIVPWRRLVHIDEHCRPLQFLGEGRAWLTLRNGSTVEENARNAFGHLAHWLRRQIKPSDRDIDPNATPVERIRDRFAPSKGHDDFFGWWAREVQTYVFGEKPISRAEDLEQIAPLRERVAQYSRTLDQIEEECVARFDRA